MFELKENVLNVVLPEGKTQAELVEIAKAELQKVEKDLYGKDIKINGRITTAMSLFMGHKLAHITKSVSIFDPKQNEYVIAISH
jgi:hypothetical protein